MITRAVCDSLGLAMDEGERVKMQELNIPSTAQASMGGFGMGFGATQTTSFDPGMANPFMDQAPGATQAFQPAGYEINPVTGLPEEVPAANPFADPADAGFAPAEPEFVAAPAPVEASLPQAQDPRTTQLLNAASPILEELVSEIRRSIDYYSSQGGVVNRILLCGGSAKINGLAGYVSRSVSLPTELLDSTRNVSVSAKNTTGDAHPEFAVAIGNGLHILFD
jgi:type IV pilus assembly protein PilM